MSGRYLLDTNIVIDLFAEEQNVIAFLEEAQEVFLPVIVLGEMYFGALRSQRVKENIHRLTAFAEQSVVLDCDAKVARRYGEVKNMLRKRGRPIPENDIWIAAIALENNLTLVSRDDHFLEVDGLKLKAC
uniref:Ribonuclease VapC n=1 Tax=Chlorobium phaeobacteroides (strain BS1) TaxID=331678 RepID=B3ELY0_CHLPB